MKKKGIHKRSLVQSLFFLTAMGVTINQALISAGKGISWLSSGYIHYVCPVCGVITIYQYFASSLDWATKLMNPVTYVLLATMLMAIFFGPIFCGWMCPFGTFQDMVAELLGTKVSGKKFNKRIHPKIDANLRYLRYGSLIAVLYMTAKSMTAVLETVNPYHALLDLFTGEFAVIGLIVLAVIVVLSLFVQRPWCKYLCPYGALLGLFNVLRLRPVVRTSSTCVGCKKCDRACPMNIEVSVSEVVRDHQCIACRACVSGEACPIDDTVTVKGTKGIDETYELTPKNVAVYVLSFLTVVAVSANIMITKADSEILQVDASTIEIELDGTYADGTYTGEGTGFNTGLIVEVTIENNQITAIDIIEHNETVGYYESAFESLPNTIIASQSTDVDAVSGATRSSEGIIEAVNDALSSAGTANASARGSTEPETEAEVEIILAAEDTEAPEAEEATEGPIEIKMESPAETTAESGAESVAEAPSETAAAETTVAETTQAPTEAASAGIYTDGTYTGFAEGYGGTLSLEVTVSNGSITSIDITDNDETPTFLQRAMSVIDDIIANQSTDVDIVSGATYSSNGIINAAEEAINQAK